MYFSVLIFYDNLKNSDFVLKSLTGLLSERKYCWILLTNVVRISKKNGQRNPIGFQFLTAMKQLFVGHVTNTSKCMQVLYCDFLKLFYSKNNFIFNINYDNLFIKQKQFLFRNVTFYVWLSQLSGLHPEHTSPDNLEFHCNFMPRRC